MFCAEPGRRDPSSIRVAILASGAIALPAVAALVADPEITVVSLLSQPDRPSGRRRTLTPTPVTAWARDRGLPVATPESVNRSVVRAALANQGVDLLVVFAFGQILRTALLELPRVGCVNVHASLLPKHRGASPVNAAILAGDPQSGLSIMRMTRGLDEGPVYEQFPCTLSGRETASELEECLAHLAAREVPGSLKRLVRDGLVPRPQEASQASYAPKLSKEHGRLHWQHAAVLLERQVRAYQPWPGAWFTLTTPKGPRQVTVVAASAEAGPAAAPGVVIQADKRDWRVACGSGILRIETLIPEGKGRMSAADFLRGCPVPAGSTL
jgi:methionyl-tRNA formyltransferase